jgi:hypothetical protein
LNPILKVQSNGHSRPTLLAANGSSTVSTDQQEIKDENRRDEALKEDASESSPSIIDGNMGTMSIDVGMPQPSAATATAAVETTETVHGGISESDTNISPLLPSPPLPPPPPERGGLVGYVSILSPHESDAVEVSASELFSRPPPSDYWEDPKTLVSNEVEIAVVNPKSPIDDTALRTDTGSFAEETALISSSDLSPAIIEVFLPEDAGNPLSSSNDAAGPLGMLPSAIESDENEPFPLHSSSVDAIAVDGTELSELKDGPLDTKDTHCEPSEHDSLTLMHMSHQLSITTETSNESASLSFDPLSPYGFLAKTPIISQAKEGLYI